MCTGKSLSEALFLHQLTHNMTTDCSLNYKFNIGKFLAQNMGRTCCVQKLFLTFRTISVHNMFSPCSAKIRASDNDLPVSKWIFGKSEQFHSWNTYRYIFCQMQIAEVKCKLTLWNMVMRSKEHRETNDTLQKKGTLADMHSISTLWHVVANC